MTSITYADLCIERAEKATEEPWVGNLLGIYSKPTKSWVTGDDIVMNDNDFEFITHARIDVPKLARRLKKAIDMLKTVDELYIITPSWRAEVACLIEQLEAMPEGR